MEFTQELPAELNQFLDLFMIGVKFYTNFAPVKQT